MDLRGKSFLPSVKVRSWTYGKPSRRSRKVYIWFRRYTICLSIHEANRG